MKNYLFIFLFLNLSLLAKDKIEDVWLKYDEKNKPQLYVSFYQKSGKFHGKIVGSHEPGTGRLRNTLDKPEERAPNVKGNPYMAGLDMIWNLSKEGDEYTDGKIMDPTKGNIYNAKAWFEEGILKVKGYLSFFGKTLEFHRIPKPPFKVPDSSSFKLVIPEKA